MKSFPREDIAILRGYATELKSRADNPANAELKERWVQHNSLCGEKPLIFVSPEGSWAELLPEATLKCGDAQARELERQLRQRIIHADHIMDDTPVESSIVIERFALPLYADWGIQPIYERSGTSGGAWRVRPAVTEVSDWKALKMPRLNTDDSAQQDYYAAVSEAVGDILTVELTGIKTFGFHMMHIYCDLRGMANMMTDLYDEPGMVHEVIGFFTEGYLSVLDEAEKLGVLALNNDGHLHYTGGIGYTRELPPKGAKPEKVRTADVWAAAEAQEFAQVSPEMHETFILQYERKILERFGLNGYGCCDDLTHKLHNVKKIKNLRRVGICPWADLEKCADQLQKDYIMTWKPQPAYLAGKAYDEAFVEDYLTQSLRKCKHARVEIVLRDTHTCGGDISRFTKFTRSARRAIASVYE